MYQNQFSNFIAIICIQSNKSDFYDLQHQHRHCDQGMRVQNKWSNADIPWLLQTWSSPVIMILINYLSSPATSNQDRRPPPDYQTI